MRHPLTPPSFVPSLPSQTPQGTGGRAPLSELHSVGGGGPSPLRPLLGRWPMPSLTRDQAVVVVRWLAAHSPLGKARGTVLKWLVEAGDRQQVWVALTL